MRETLESLEVLHGYFSHKLSVMIAGTCDPEMFELLVSLQQTLNGLGRDLAAIFNHLKR